MNRQRYISVPKDYEAMQALEYGDEKSNQIIEWELQEKEFEELNNLGVLKLINNGCGVITDDFESEWLEDENLLKAIKALEKIDEFEVVKKLKELINLAIKNNTCVAFDF